MHRSLWMRRVAAATALALLATACGNGDDGEPTTDDDVAAPADDDADVDDDDADVDDDGEEIDRPERDDVLDIGYILPESGPLAFLGAPQTTAVRMAVDDINAAGGVLGSDVTLATGDEAGDAAVARDTAARLVNDGVDAIVGAAASGMSQEFIQTLFDNQIVQCSGSNTSPAFTDQDNNAFYFRTVPPDEAVAPIIANTVIGDGFTAPAVLARADDYGVALMELVDAGLTEQGVEPVLVETYDTETDDFDSLVSQVTGAGADTAVVIGFDEAGALFGSLIEAGFPAGSLYGGDGVFGPALADTVGTDISGLKVIGAAGGADFNERLNEAMPDGEQGNVIYGGQVYDCVIVIALAAEAAQSADPAVFNDEIENVTKDGTECSSFEECRDLLAAGEDIDYTGASGPLDLVRPDPTFGRYAIGQFTADGLEIIGSEDVDLADLG
ncbi:ABC transporter substrate-binding protein [Nitriliruptor alkaliphilus]|uniref:ABC transporter substrate-binding protein n=1 Tax=Nitriliruptor alkaliphilus TaxID=427918 RepID=UPI00069758A2|nr:ABC transporter substrate-binding protein [Nitriliruptor alkaliphilus]